MCLFRCKPALLNPALALMCISPREYGHAFLQRLQGVLLETFCSDVFLLEYSCLSKLTFPWKGVAHLLQQPSTQQVAGSERLPGLGWCSTVRPPPSTGEAWLLCGFSRQSCCLQASWLPVSWGTSEFGSL